MTLKVAYVVSCYPTVTHTFITREIDRLRAAGAEVSVFSLHAAPPQTLLTDADRRNARETSVILPPPIIEFAYAHTRALLTRPRTYLQTLKHALSIGEGGVRNKLWQLFYFGEGVLLWRRLRARKITHVHAHLANSGGSVALFAAEIGRPERMTFSFTMHGPTEFDQVVSFSLAEKVRCASFVACIGYYCRSQLMKLVEPEHWPKLEIVHCGVDVEKFDLAPPSPTAGGAPLKILSIGRLVPDKGQSVLLDACAQLVGDGIDVRLTLIGDGNDRGRLEELAERRGLNGRVSFMGSVGQDAIREHYADSDVFCLSSFAEGIPVVLMEAMARGRPVIATQIMGIPELVINERTGLLVPPGDAPALRLVAAFKRLATDPELAARLVSAGRNRVEQEYALNGSTTRLLELFSKAVAA